MRTRRFHNYVAAPGGGITLIALLFWLSALPGAAQDRKPSGTEPATQQVAPDSNNFQLLGVYSGTNGFVGEAVNARFPVLAGRAGLGRSRGGQ